MWTLDELVERVRAALAAQYPGAPNGRVRDVPDRRAVRWYTTTGLVDRPVIRGRTAFYGPRHLLQLVALKRRQAAGLSLADIQAELTGATDQTLLEVARLPVELLPVGLVDASAAPRERFWADRGAPATVVPATVEPAIVERDNAERPQPDAVRGPATPLAAVALGGGVTLLLPGKPQPGDYAAIAAAARPLLDLLIARGLTDPAPPGAPGASFSADR